MSQNISVVDSNNAAQNVPVLNLTQLNTLIANIQALKDAYDSALSIDTTGLATSALQTSGNASLTTIADALATSGITIESQAYPFTGNVPVTGTVAVSNLFATQTTAEAIETALGTLATQATLAAIQTALGNTLTATHPLTGTSFEFRQTVATPGTSVQLPSNTVTRQVLIEPLPTNTGNVFLQTVSAGGDLSGTGLIIEPTAAPKLFQIPDTVVLAVDATVGGEGIQGYGI